MLVVGVGCAKTWSKYSQLCLNLNKKAHCHCQARYCTLLHSIEYHDGQHTFFGFVFAKLNIALIAALDWMSWWPTNMPECWIWPSDDLLECLVMIQLPTNTFIQRQVFHGRPFIRLNLLNTRPQFIATSVCYPSRSSRFPKNKIELGIDLRLVSLNIQALLRAITIISG